MILKSLSWKPIVVLILAGVVFIWLLKAPIISWYLTDKIRVPISVRSVSMWPSQTVFRHFRVANPKGFKNRTAFEAETATVDYRTRQLFGDPSEIDRIEIDGIFLSIDCSNPLCSSNNWTQIGNGMAKKEEREKEKRGRKMVVHKMVLSDMTVEVRGLGIGSAPQTKQIARLEFDEIDSEKGFPTKKLIQAIFQGSGFNQYIKDAFNPAKAIQNFLPNLFGDGSEEID